MEQEHKCLQCFNYFSKLVKGLDICNSCYWKNITIEKDEMSIYENHHGNWSKQNIGRW